MPMIHKDDWVNAQEMHIQHASTFKCPSPKDLDALKRGDVVKICNGYERFWVCVEKVFNKAVHGKVLNFLIHLTSPCEYNLGDIVSFRKHDIYEISDMDFPLDYVQKVNEVSEDVNEDKESTRKTNEALKVLEKAMDIMEKFVKVPTPFGIRRFDDEEFGVFNECIAYWEKGMYDLSPSQTNLIKYVKDMIGTSKNVSEEEISDIRDLCKFIEDEDEEKKEYQIKEKLIYDKIERGEKLTPEEETIYNDIVYDDVRFCLEDEEYLEDNEKELYRLMRYECIANRMKVKGYELSEEDREFYDTFDTRLRELVDEMK